MVPLSRSAKAQFPPPAAMAVKSSPVGTFASPSPEYPQAVIVPAWAIGPAPRHSPRASHANSHLAGPLANPRPPRPFCGHVHFRSAAQSQTLLILLYLALTRFPPWTGVAPLLQSGAATRRWRVSVRESHAVSSIACRRRTSRILDNHRKESQGQQLGSLGSQSRCRATRHSPSLRSPAPGGNSTHRQTRGCGAITTTCG